MSRLSPVALAAMRRPWEGRQVRTRVEWSAAIPAGTVGTVERYNASSDVFLVDFGQGGVYVWPEMLDLIPLPATDTQRAVAHGGPA
jgi:hypothetical protein